MGSGGQNFRHILFWEIMFNPLPGLCLLVALLECGKHRTDPNSYVTRKTVTNSALNCAEKKAQLLLIPLNKQNFTTLGKPVGGFSHFHNKFK